MIPARFTFLLYGLLLSLFMTFLVSAVSTLNAVGMSEGVLFIWLNAWFRSWLVAFPAVLLVAPVTRKLVDKLTLSD